MRASRFLSSSSSFFVTAEESVPSSVALDIDDTAGPGAEPGVDLTSLE